MKYIQIFFLILIISCQNKDSKKGESFQIDFFDHELNWAATEPVLQIYFESKECGEWGGHEEYMTVIRKSKQKYKLKYKKYQVNCDSKVKVFDGIGYLKRPLNTLSIEKEIEINEDEKLAILDFSIDMVKSKFKEEELISHAEIQMSICNSDSTFYIWKYGGNANSYSKLLKGLKIN